MSTKILLLTSTLTLGLMTAGLLTAPPRPADAHCQLPCGIYDDPARLTQMQEDVTTIAKASKLMNELAAKTDVQSRQQFTRWTMTKEKHAQQIIDTVSDYFLAQKIKPVAPGAEAYDAYLHTLADHHAVIVAAMKAKQKADPETAEALRDAVTALSPYWAAQNEHHSG